IILRAPPPCAGPAGAAETGEAFDAAPAAVDDAAPHLGQNFAPASIAVPHELQNAISHLVGEFVTGAGVYSKLAQDAACSTPEAGRVIGKAQRQKNEQPKD